MDVEKVKEIARILWLVYVAMPKVDDGGGK